MRAPQGNSTNSFNQLKKTSLKNVECMKAKANANAGQLNPKDTEIPDAIVFFVLFSMMVLAHSVTDCVLSSYSEVWVLAIIVTNNTVLNIETWQHGIIKSRTVPFAVSRRINKMPVLTSSKAQLQQQAAGKCHRPTLHFWLNYVCACTTGCHFVGQYWATTADRT